MLWVHYQISDLHFPEGNPPAGDSLPAGGSQAGPLGTQIPRLLLLLRTDNSCLWKTEQ